MRSAMPAMCVRPVHRSVLSSGPSFAGTHRCAQHLVCEILQVRCQDVRGITAGRGWPLVSGWPGIICSLLPPGPTGQVHLAAEVFICFMMEVRPCLSRLRRSFEEALLDSTRLDSTRESDSSVDWSLTVKCPPPWRRVGGREAAGWTAQRSHSRNKR